MALSAKISKAKRLFYTLAPLKPVQLWGLFYYRVWRRFIPFKIPAQIARETDMLTVSFERYQPDSWLGDNEFSFLNSVAEIDPNKWAAENETLLWHYNLHYFDFLNAKNVSQEAEAQAALIEKWWPLHQPLQGVAWEPYPASLRAVNFCKWGWLQNSDYALIPSLEWTAILDRHYQEIKRKLEYHIQANHLFANLKALWFLQAALPEYRAKESAWLCKLVLRELRVQFDSDGGHFELSPMYHRIMLWDLLDMVAIGRKIEDFSKTTQAIEEILPKAMQWMKALSHPDTEVAFFNDGCMGIAPKQNELIEYANVLGVPELAVEDGLYSGYAVARVNNALLLCDVAEAGPKFQPGHAHADTLSFEFSLNGQRLIVNSGTSEYGDGPERLRQRSTPAHSTVCVENRNSSDVWSGFRVGKQASVIICSFDKSESKTVVTGVHSGYKPVLHQRTWHFERDQLVIEDAVDGNFQKKIYFHLHPEAQAELFSDAQASVLRAIIKLGNETVQFVVDATDAALSIEENTWHPQFNMSIPSQCLVISLKANYCKTTLNWKA